MIDGVLMIALWVVVAIAFLCTVIPIGNERSTVRRLPWVTFSLMAINTAVFFVTLPLTIKQQADVAKAKHELEIFNQEHHELSADKEVRDQMLAEGLITEDDARQTEKFVELDPKAKRDYQIWLQGPGAARLRSEFSARMADLHVATGASLWYQLGLAPNGQWKLHQLVTSAFLHAGPAHLIFNMIFFFAVAYSLEDLWGRRLFLTFYLLGAAVSCVPVLINPITIPAIGASGAISATMGAFLVRLYKTKIRLFWVSLPLAIPMLAFGKKPYGITSISAYVFLPFYFLSQALYWWWSLKLDTTPTVGYSVHLAGFLFGMIFAGLISLTKIEERQINPIIESKVTVEGSRLVNAALEALERGDVVNAEQGLRDFLAKSPDDMNAILALIQVYQRKQDYKQLNAMYGRVIRHHLDHNDREAALYAYDGLLSCFPDGHIDVRIQLRDWLSICEYLEESGMNQEAAVEFDRLSAVHSDDPLIIKGCVQGGESALTAHDNERALRLFERARKLDPSIPMMSRIETGIEKCRRRLDSRPAWEEKASLKPRHISG
ncbi:MAG TPA: rhomboid family intramembrane serine protease [Blastocatellia bacterium]|nr:rhomboid family intramembrane serine protease [Blastocatellia bacterium]